MSDCMFDSTTGVGVGALQPWYDALETMRYLLPDSDAREKLVGESWQVGQTWLPA
jgi:hypothetical protein